MRINPDYVPQVMRVAADETPTIASWTCPTCGSVYPGEFRVCPRDATPRNEGADPADPLIGAVLGRTYRVVSVLGEGGMGRLYEAKHVRIDARFAIKVLHHDLARDPAQLARFEREARAAGKIRSEHVVRLFDVLRTLDGRPCMITELLEGEDLQRHLERAGKLSVEQAVPIARQLCRAVAAAHAAGVVHRDLKPANVFLCNTDDDSPFIKVFDFGVAKLEDDERLTRTDAVMGTAAYMAPEQARRAMDAGPLADVYSIGAVLYHMVTGQQPYGNVPAVSRFALLLHQEPLRPTAIESSVPAGIEAVIQHAMARETRERFPSALALEHELEAFEEAPSQMSLPVPAPISIRSSGAHVTGGVSLVRSTGGSDITLRARFARPVALGIGAVSSLFAAAWIAAVFGMLFTKPIGGERALIGVLAAVGLVGVGLLHWRNLRVCWQSAPAVSAYTRAPSRVVVAGVLALGALELLAHGVFAIFRVAPLGIGARVVLAGVVAAVALVWQSWGIRDRVMQWIG